MSAWCLVIRTDRNTCSPVALAFPVDLGAMSLISAVLRRNQDDWIAAKKICEEGPLASFCSQHEIVPAIKDLRTLPQERLLEINQIAQQILSSPEEKKAFPGLIGLRLSPVPMIESASAAPIE